MPSLYSVTTIPNLDHTEAKAGSISNDLGQEPSKFSKFVYRNPSCCAFSTVSGLNRLSTDPRYFRLYSLSNEGDCFASCISSLVYILSRA